MTVRVLFVATSFPLYEDHWSGVFIAVQARALAALGCAVTVLAPRGPNAAEHEQLGPLVVHRFPYLPRSLERLAYGGGIPANLQADPGLWLTVPPFVAALARAVSQHAAQADIVHAHWTFAGSVCARLPFRKQVPLVVSLHGSDLARSTGLYARASRMVFERAAAIIVHSNQMRTRALAAGARPDTLLQVPHGIEIDLFRTGGTTGPTTRLVAIGRLSEEKGFATLLNALRQLPPAADWSLDIIGEGPLRGDLERRAAELGLRSIRFLGGLSPARVRERLAASDLLVMPSWREGFGVVALEGMAAGLPVVGTAVGALPEIVAPGVTGLLVPPAEPASLSAALAELIADPNRRRAMGAAGRHVVSERYAANVVNQPVNELYRRLRGGN